MVQRTVLSIFHKKILASGRVLWMQLIIKVFKPTPTFTTKTKDPPRCLKFTELAVAWHLTWVKCPSWMDA